MIVHPFNSGNANPNQGSYLIPWGNPNKNILQAMKKTLCLFFLSGLSIMHGQEQKYQGQPPIKIIATDSKPVQKQWKGKFNFPDHNVTFSNEFEGARLNGITQNNDSTYTALITSENTPINISPWYAFKVWAKKKETIDLFLTYQQSIKHRYYPKLSKDGIHWSALDSSRYKAYEKGDKAFGSGSLPLKVKLTLEVGPDTLWVAGQELQNSPLVNSWMDSLTQRKYITKSTIGKSTEGRNLNMISVGNTDSKNMIMIISRQHPPEVTGYLAMKAFVETISSDSKLARRFRKKFATYVVPLMNPDGVDNGFWRHNAGGIDLNRDWANFNQPETRAVKGFMESLVKKNHGKFYFGIDFHSTWDDIYYTVDPKLKGNMPNLVSNWLDKLKENIDGYDPNISPNDKLNPTTVSRNYFFVEHGAEALVFEVGDNTPREFLKEKAVTGANELMKLMLKEIKKQ
ncbi:M14 family metallopeptidase [Maribacter polysaccharolyticus]|uniref:M14 family metallopeptidase n=1 Tax=Maribacter polysaccharolyticus TaxID=3020831 RepID=UPI00237EF41A|nr:M14 family metallopeptidase [Maribacter polysaccharolyticus]MDE3742528.1 M14 family metallopeptidase [Maribacter polysaccharolyticus]